MSEFIVLEHRRKRLIDHYGLSSAEAMDEIKELAKCMGNGSVEYCFIEVNGRIAAYGFISYIDSGIMNKVAGELFGLWVKEDSRRMGMGEYLAKLRLELAKRKSTTPTLVISQDNDASESLYKKFGFTPSDSPHPVERFRWWVHK